jgi:hypothetical protein
MSIQVLQAIAKKFNFNLEEEIALMSNSVNVETIVAEKPVKEKKPKKEKEPKEEKPKKEKEPKEEKPKEEKPNEEKPKEEKRIKRFTLTKELTACLNKVGVEYTNKLRDAFKNYIEKLPEKEYRENSIAFHMDVFATNSAPKTEKDVAPEIVKLDTDELVKLNLVSPNSGGTTEKDVGPFWDNENGRFVEGLPEDTDDDFESYPTPWLLNDREYVVGVKTRRVYLVKSEGDVFAGWAGVGMFKKI